MKMKKFAGLMTIAMGLSAAALANSPKALSDVAKRFFPAIGQEVASCAQQWPGYFRDGDREIIIDAYFTYLTHMLASDTQARNLKKQFGALARYWHTDTTAMLKVFGCARYITGEVMGEQNLFVEANRLFLNFDGTLKAELIANIDSFREDFAGKEAKDKDTKINNIIAHIEHLEQLTVCSSPDFEADLRAQGNSIYNFILAQHDQRRELALAFSIAAAKSSLEIVKYFEPPTKKELAGIVAREIGHSIADAIGGFFGDKKK